MKEEVESDPADDSDENASKFDCLKCGNAYSTARSLKRHEQSVHTNNERAKRKQKSLKCEPKSEMDDTKTIPCDECTERFATREEYLRHKIVHKKSSFECDVCQKKFQSRFRLKVHYPMHMAVKPFLCEVCSRPFVSSHAHFVFILVEN